MSPQVSVIVPTLNEAGNIVELIERVVAAMSQAGSGSVEIVVVDDGSADGTPDLVRTHAGRYSIKLIERRGERGLSSAIIKGVEAAGGDIVVVMDADLSHPPEVIPALVQVVASGTADLAIGSRYVRGGSVAENWPIRRRLCSRLATWSVLPLTNVRDPLAGFFAAGRQDVLLVMKTSGGRGFKILLDWICFGRWNRIVELPIVFRNRKDGESKLNGAVVEAFIVQLVNLYLRAIINYFRPAWQSNQTKEQSNTWELRQRAGFTLVEFLVVIAVTGLLHTLLMPVVTAAREAARRTSCATHLRKVATAVQLYHTEQQSYPQSSYDAKMDYGLESRSWSWIAKILPLLEEQAVYDRWVIELVKTARQEGIHSAADNLSAVSE